MRQEVSQNTDRVARAIVHAAYCVHTTLGPGLLESVYEACLCLELERQGLRFERQKVLPIQYQGHRIEAGLRLDLLVEGCVVVELKAVESLLPVHAAQLLTYLKLADMRLGLLINFNAVRIKEGIRRFVHSPGP